MPARKRTNRQMVGEGQPVTEADGLEVDDGLEVEKEDPEAAITRPFDPEKIKIRTTHLSVDLLVSRVKHRDIDLAPDFQRLAGIWRDEQKSRLIESLLLRIPIPVFYVAADENETWSVVDGLQRTSTIHGYATDEFPLKALEYLAQFDGYRFSELPRIMQRRIYETQLVVNVIESGTPKEVMFNIFRRINTGGLPLTGQEIRNALNPGPVRCFLKVMAASSEFKAATYNSVSPKRMGDQECVLRFLAFHTVAWESYSENDLDRFLGQAMVRINRMSNKQREDLQTDFKRAMTAAHKIFGEHAFRKRYRENETRRRPVSKALLEVWSVALARRSDRDLERLISRKRSVVRRAVSLLNNDREFETAISYSTGVPSRVRKRFHAIDELIQACL